MAEPRQGGIVGDVIPSYLSVQTAVSNIDLNNLTMHLRNYSDGALPEFLRYLIFRTCSIDKRELSWSEIRLSVDDN